MAGWDDTIRAHAVWGALEAVQAALAEVGAPRDPADLDAVERLKSVVSHARAVLDNADPQLVSLNALTSIQGGLTQLLDQLPALNERFSEAYLLLGHQVGHLRIDRESPSSSATSETWPEEPLTLYKVSE